MTGDVANTRSTTATEFSMIAKAREQPRTNAIGKGLCSTQIPQCTASVFTRQPAIFVEQNHVMIVPHFRELANTR